MSNDRLFVRCVQCREAIAIGKAWHGQAAGLDGPPELVAAFINAHAERCGGPFQRGKVDLGRAPGFRFETEETLGDLPKQS